MNIYLLESPRRLALSYRSEDSSSTARCLIISAEASDRGPSRTLVEFLPVTDVSFDGATRLNSRTILGCLGLINISNGLNSLVKELPTDKYVQTSSLLWSLQRPTSVVYFLELQGLIKSPGYKRSHSSA